MRQAPKHLRTTWRRGNAILEAALVLPVLLSLSFGTVEFGHFFFVKHTIQAAARDGTRAAILPGADSTSVARAVERTMVAAGIPTTKYTVSVVQVNKDTLTESAVDLATAATSTPIKVKVTCTWSNVGIRPMNLITGTKQVVGFTIMVKE